MDYYKLNCAAMLAVLASAAGMTSAVAEQTDQGAVNTESAITEDTATMKTVVVTAQRREQSLQQVPIAITAIAGDLVANSGVSSSQELDILAPGLITTNSNGSSQFFLRGIGSQAVVIGSESAVATYVDGVYIASTTGAVFGLNNIERLEVLRGPQGTLFGRNATGGVVQVITRQPDGKPTLEAGASYGSYETATGSLYASTGLTDSVAVNLSVYGQDQGKGYGRNIPFDQKINYTNEFAVRGGVLLTPSDTLKVSLSADYDRQRNDMGTNRQPVDGSRTFLGTGRIGGPLDGNYNVPVFASSSQWGLAQTVDLDLGFGQLRSITAYREYEWRNEYDQDITPVRIVDLVRDESSHTFQQEVLLSGSSGALDWTTGAIYFRMTPSIHPISTVANPISETNIARYSQNEVKSYAVFGQGTYALTQKLKLTAGIRYTEDRATLNGQVVAMEGHPRPVGTVIQSVRDLKLSSDKVTGRLGVDYQLSDNALIYASASRGFKSGQFNITSIMQTPTQPETLDAYEVGAKTDFFDRRVRLNAALFHYDYDDIQMSAVPPPPASFQTLNAAAGRAIGGEFEVKALPPVDYGRLEIGAALTLLDTEYRSFPGAPYNLPNPFTAPPAGVVCPVPSSVAPGGNTACVIDASGKSMIRAPELTASFNIGYTMPLSVGDCPSSGILRQKAA